MIRRLDDVVLFGVDSARSRAYLSLLVQAGLRPAACVVVPSVSGAPCAAPEPTDVFDNLTPLAEAARAAGIAVSLAPEAEINAEATVAALAACPQRVVIFSGPSGGLVGAPLFATGKTFLHVHPGRLPAFRGSTTIYYGLLAEGCIWATAIRLVPDIDRGPVLDAMRAELPADRLLLDRIYDPAIRARLMVRLMKRYAETGELPERPQSSEDEATTYYVIHPVLKHIALLSRSVGKGNAGEAGA
jgi:methionyl-tRNA formyltransferase